ncbi:DUF6544 family protein [Luteitalea pratensis]|uniref:DUF6544 family protein n=1 Tax=Luteitalea pratensis TaxID=1855912 RepID=UPI0012FF73A2|nr:DUF6544 family protein [Luteitalea pratensis]
MFTLFLVLHGLIHVMGVAKAFGYADLPGLTLPISPGMGLAWEAAACLFVAAAVAIYTDPRHWWILGLCAVAVSMIAIVPSWRDAKFGAAANGLAIVGVVFGVLAYGPASLRAAYERDVNASFTRADPQARRVVTEADLAALPSPVQRYLRVAGVVGQPRVREMFVRMHGRIRGGREMAWMPFSSEQHNRFGDTPSRMFYMTATRALLPIQGYHRFVASAASMLIKAAALVPVVDMDSLELTQSETVTLFNDLCILAPSALLDSAVTWEPTMPRAADGDGNGGTIVRAHFSHEGRTITADLVFGANDMLADFISDDRYATLPDGTTMVRQRWSTPVRAVRPFGKVLLASAAEARWHPSDDSWAYLELTIDDVRYDPEH